MRGEIELYSRDEANAKIGAFIYSFATKKHHIALYAGPAMPAIDTVLNATYSYAQQFGRLPRDLYVGFDKLLKMQLIRMLGGLTGKLPIILDSRSKDIFDVAAFDKSDLPRDVLQHLSKTLYGAHALGRHSVICLSPPGPTRALGPLPGDTKPGALLHCIETEDYTGFLYGMSTLLPVAMVRIATLAYRRRWHRAIDALYLAPDLEASYQRELENIPGGKYYREYAFLANPTRAEIRKVPIHLIDKLPEEVRLYLDSLSLTSVSSPIIGLFHRQAQAR